MLKRCFCKFLAKQVLHWLCQFKNSTRLPRDCHKSSPEVANDDKVCGIVMIHAAFSRHTSDTFHCALKAEKTAENNLEANTGLQASISRLSRGYKRLITRIVFCIYRLYHMQDILLCNDCNVVWNTRC